MDTETKKPWARRIGKRFQMLSRIWRSAGGPITAKRAPDTFIGRAKKRRRAAAKLSRRLAILKMKRELGRRLTSEEMGLITNR